MDPSSRFPVANSVQILVRRRDTVPGALVRDRTRCFNAEPHWDRLRSRPRKVSSEDLWCAGDGSNTFKRSSLDGRSSLKLAPTFALAREPAKDILSAPSLRPAMAPAVPAGIPAEIRWEW
jgi:hypothetical protein